MNIISRNIDGLERQLILSETLVMIDWLDEIEFTISRDKGFNEDWKLIMAFSNEGDVGASTGTTNNRTYRLVLHKWDTAPYVEATTPWELQIDNRTVYVRWRVSSTVQISGRLFSISIWRNV